MGTFIHSVAARTAERESVRSLLTAWLSAKGFEISAEPPLFELAADERGLCLFSNGEWVIVLYNQMTREGERLIHELGKLDVPILEAWVHDSDVWGYELHRDGELVASFNSNPHYFGRFAQQSLPVNGDVATLCEVCRLSGLEQQLAGIQITRALFAEGICQQFCTAINAAPLAMDYQMIRELGLTGPIAMDVASFQMESLYFIERNRPPEPPPATLHSLSLRESDSVESPPLTPEMERFVRSMQWRVSLLRFLLYPLWLVFRIIIWFSVRYQNLRQRGWLRNTDLGLPGEGIYRQLFQMRRENVHRLGNQLINDRYRCRITIPDEATIGPQPGATWVFHVNLSALDVHCRAVRPSDLRQAFRLHPSSSLLEDVKFSIGALQARTIVRRFEMREHMSVYYNYYVQTPKVVYLFEITWPGELSPENRRLVDELVRSFREG
jgi:hypothetical protein